MLKYQFCVFATFKRLPVIFVGWNSGECCCNNSWRPRLTCSHPWPEWLCMHSPLFGSCWHYLHRMTEYMCTLQCVCYLSTFYYLLILHLLINAFSARVFNHLISLFCYLMHYAFFHHCYCTGKLYEKKNGIPRFIKKGFSFPNQMFLAINGCVFLLE